MQEAPEEPQEEPQEHDLDSDFNIRVLAGSTSTAASYEFRGEDHTLGNALRHIIMKNPDVEFCGYSIPHPAEPKMHLRIQTYDEVPAQECLEKGLDDLKALCDIVIEKFEDARDEFEESQQRTLAAQ